MSGHPSTHPYQLTAPVAMTVKPGGAGTFEVVNTGTKPLVVHDSFGRFTANAVRYPAADHATLTTFDHPWLSVWPSSFTLAPGHAETVHVKATVPAGAQGDHYLNVVWTVKPGQAHGAGLHLAGAVATSVTIPLPGTATPVTSHGVATAPRAPVHGGMDPVTLAGIGLVSFAVLAVIVIIIAMRRRRGGHAGPYLA
jgi:hypothetical protein